MELQATVQHASVAYFQFIVLCTSLEFIPVNISAITASGVDALLSSMAGEAEDKGSKIKNNDNVVANMIIKKAGRPIMNHLGFIGLGFVCISVFPVL